MLQAKSPYWHARKAPAAMLQDSSAGNPWTPPGPKSGLNVTREEREKLRKYGGPGERKGPFSDDTGETVTIDDVEYKKLYCDAIFEGGGVKGFAFLGALQAFADYGICFRKVAGTSAGAR